MNKKRHIFTALFLLCVMSYALAIDKTVKEDKTDEKIVKILTKHQLVKETANKKYQKQLVTYMKTINNIRKLSIQKSNAKAIKELNYLYNDAKRKNLQYWQISVKKI